MRLGPDNTLLCPLCDGPNVHVEGAGFHPDGEDEVVTLTGWCETSFHRWFVELRTHKGDTYVQVEGRGRI